MQQSLPLNPKKMHNQRGRKRSFVSPNPASEMVSAQEPSFNKCSVLKLHRITAHAKSVHPIGEDKKGQTKKRAIRKWSLRMSGLHNNQNDGSINEKAIFMNNQHSHLATTTDDDLTVIVKIGLLREVLLTDFKSTYRCVDAREKGFLQPYSNKSDLEITDGINALKMKLYGA